ncbi:MAG: T9SS type A sorting domain-containing protein [Bacteroidales bacterium]|jgi:hypothetical protein|nr:T9SS type A sorting domain-containing protein [Bacteroidales bacterium]
MKKHIFFFSILFIIFNLSSHVQGNTNLNKSFSLLQSTSEDTVYQTVSIIICRSELPFFYANNLYTDEGNYEISLKTPDGKDSIITLQLKVLNVPLQPGQIIGDSLVNQLGHYMYKVEPVVDAEEYTWQISNLQWIVSKSYKKDSTKIFIPTGGSGMLTVTAKNQCGISPARQFLIQSTLDIDTYMNADKLSLYPNPTKDFITIDFSSIHKGGELYLYDINGKLLIKNTITNQPTILNLSKLSVGVYFIKIYLEDKSLQTIKIYKNQ